jgi:amidase
MDVPDDMSDASILEADIEAIHRLYGRRDLTVSQVVEFYLTRIAHLDLATDDGPPFNCIARIAPDVCRQAQALDQEIEHRGVVKALHGIPVWIKDNIDVEGLPTTCGCAALADHVAGRDAVLVGRLRAAGAVIMGKAGMSELGVSVAGYSTMSGRIGNAIDARNPPGDSSSGSAVATSLNFAIGGIGVDDCGSICRPAALNACVGFRPTVGLVSRAGLFSYAASETSPGPIARTIRDAAILLDVMAESTDSGSYAAALTRRTVEGLRVGVLTTAGPLDLMRDLPAGARVGFQERLAELERAGASVQRLCLDGLELRRLSRVEYHNSQIAALRARTSPPRTLRELYGNHASAPHTQSFGRHPLIKYGPSIALPNVHAWFYRRVQDRNSAALRALLHETGCACALAVTTGHVSMLAAVSGAPHLTLPAGWVAADLKMARDGFVEGTSVPWGISVFAPAGWDREVLAVGYALEQLFNARRPPHVSASGRNGHARDITHFNRLKHEIARRCSGRLQLDDDGRRYIHPTQDEFKALVCAVLHELDRSFG